MSAWLQTIIDRASITTNARLLSRELEQVIDRAGFDWFIYLYVRPCGTRLLSNTPEIWQQQYRDLNYISVDPIVAIARARMRAFSWDLGQLRRDGAKDAEGMLRAAQQHGLRSGLSIPIGTAFGHIAIMTAISSSPRIKPEWQVDDVTAATAVAQLHARFQNGEKATRNQSPVILTPKQAVCLRWSAEGKSMRAIATIEEMTYSAVAFHLSNARQALDALSIAQATAIATKLNLI